MITVTVLWRYDDNGWLAWSYRTVQSARGCSSSGFQQPPQDVFNGGWYWCDGNNPGQSDSWQLALGCNCVNPLMVMVAVCREPCNMMWCGWLTYICTSKSIWLHIQIFEFEGIMSTVRQWFGWWRDIWWRIIVGMNEIVGHSWQNAICLIKNNIG